MMEPIALLVGLITIWNQLNNYGIDSEKYPHLKNVRVRREIENQLYGVHNRVDFQPTNDSIIMKSIIKKREKRQTYNGYNNGYNSNGINRNGYNNNGINSNGYNNNGYDNGIEKPVLAPFPPDSPYYKQTPASVPVNYNQNNGYNFNTANGNAIQANINNEKNKQYLAINGEVEMLRNKVFEIKRNVKEKLTLSDIRLNATHPNNGYLKISRYRYNSYIKNETVNNNTAGNFNLGLNNNSRLFYNPFKTNASSFNQQNDSPYGYNVVPLQSNNGTNGYYNQGNGTLFNNNALGKFNSTFNVTAYKHNQNNNKTILGAYFMGSDSCPGLLKGVTILGVKMCVDDEY